MRTLSLVEVEQVSGAGIIADIISALSGGVTGSTTNTAKCNQNKNKTPGFVIISQEDLDKLRPSSSECKPQPVKPSWWLCK